MYITKQFEVGLVYEQRCLLTKPGLNSGQLSSNPHNATNAKSASRGYILKGGFL